jgi:hypothetical protein
MEAKMAEKQHDYARNHGKQTSTHEEAKQRRRFKIGNLEKEILLVLAEVESTDERPAMSRSRHGRVACLEWKKSGKPHVPLIWVRNSIFRSRCRRGIQASDKANFSRAVKSLEAKGLDCDVQLVFGKRVPDARGAHRRRRKSAARVQKVNS